MSKWLIMSDKKCFWYSLLTLISHNGYTHTLHPLYYAIWATPILLSYVAPFVSYKLRTLWETQHYWGNAASYRSYLRTLSAKSHPNWAPPHPSKLRRTLLSYAAHPLCYCTWQSSDQRGILWTTSHPLSDAAPFEICRTLWNKTRPLNYVAP
jgi:hypothetical protein